jgi:DNA-binding response OmpR family regulator
MNGLPVVLTVDDEIMNLQLIELALKNEFKVITATNGHDAVSLLNEHNVDLILLDVMMPDLNGFDVCKIIKTDPLLANIPIIFLTALTTLESEMLGLGFGGIDYLTKPVDIGILKLRVRNHIEAKLYKDLLEEQRDLLEQKNDALEKALARVKQLEGIIPICMYCKKIRDDQSTWHQLEYYISQHSGAQFSHGMCPHCAEEQMVKIKNMADQF